MKTIAHHIIPIVMMIVTCFNCIAQKHRKKPNFVIAKEDSANHSAIIPDKIFSMNVDGIIISRKTLSKKYDNPTYIYQVFWPAPFVDGDCVLTIDRHQIVLTTGHNNPNPDQLFWFANITHDQYQHIIENINSCKNCFTEYTLHYSFARQLHYKNFVPELPIPKKWTHRQNYIHEKDYKEKMYTNALKLITFFNNGVKIADQIRFPDLYEFKKIKPILTAARSDELEWAIPTKSNK